MAIARTCTECGASLAGKAPQTKTCGPKHRQERSRRIRAMGKAEAREAQARVSLPPAIREIALAVNDRQQNLVSEVVKQELAPIVRDALTESTLRAIQDLLDLTPAAVAALAEDIADDDPVIRQRAYALQMKYTIGHPALVQPADSGAGGQMVVNFNLPRPDHVESEVVDEASALRTCDLCDAEKPEADFVGSSDRCQQCVDEWKTRITDQFA